jgi:nucleoside-diphosphate-sugar epimerase
MTDVLVLGGTGHLGRDIVKQLRSQGRTVRVLALPEAHGRRGRKTWSAWLGEHQAKRAA